MTLSQVTETKIRHFLRLGYRGFEEPMKLIDRALELKRKSHAPSNRKTIATASFNHNSHSLPFLQDTIAQLGHRHVHFDAARSSIAKGESLQNTFRTLQLIGVDVIVVRGSVSKLILSLARELGIDVVNVSGMSDAEAADKLRDLYGGHSGLSSSKLEEISIIATRFSENSTRTLLSFQMAIVRLGYRHVDMPPSSDRPRTAKQLPLSPSLAAFVARHANSTEELLSYTEDQNIPVINAGSGTEAHPTQALGDLITIKERLGKKGKIKGTKVTIIGDVRHSRVARSLMKWLDHLGASVSIAGPPEMLPRASDGTKQYTDLDEAIAEARIAYVLRPQFERHKCTLVNPEEYAKRYMFDVEHLESMEPNDGFVMHAGPINEGVDISAEAARSERSLIDKQVENGVFARMAALEYALGKRMY